MAMPISSLNIYYIEIVCIGVADYPTTLCRSIKIPEGLTFSKVLFRIHFETFFLIILNTTDQFVDNVDLN